MKKEPNSDVAFIFIILVFLSFLAFKQKGPHLFEVILRHRFLTAGTISIFIMSGFKFLQGKAKRALNEREQKNFLFQRQTADSIRVGQTPAGDSVFIPLSARRMHTQIVGTTNAGKTESVIIPWAVSDIADGRGLILIDGKSDSALLDKLYAYSSLYKRTKDFRLLSLVNIERSSTFNPLIGGTPEEITERVFSAFTIENEYYRDQQYEVLKHVLILFAEAQIKPTFQRIIQAVTEPLSLVELSENSKDQALKSWLDRYLGLSKDEREKRSSGLVTQMGYFATGTTSELFNDESPMIDIEQVMREGLIVYCQLPVMKTPVLGKATGKMILQAIQSAVSSRHLDKEKGVKFFSIYLDDFTEYLTPGFVSLLNKSRSGNVGVTFAHQAQGDLAGLGEDVKNIIMTNSNLKVFMRTNEPETAEYFSRTLGTKQNTKLTERQKKGLLGSEKTGDGSVRDVEEFIHHPNLFKRDLGTGEAVMIVPLERGTQSLKLKFQMLRDLPSKEMPVVHKSSSALLGFAKPIKAETAKNTEREETGRTLVERAVGRSA